MNKNYINSWSKQVRKPISDEIMFKITTSLKIAAIPAMTFCVLMIFLWIILKINCIFFEANNLENALTLKDAYSEYMSQVLIESIPWVLLWLFVIILVGIYISYLFLRPFKIIGRYCETIIKGKKTEYDQELFTDLRLLTSFSEYFFHTMENALDKKKFYSLSILKKYQKIHQPVFEKMFFIQFFIILSIISVLGMISTYTIMVDIYINLVQLSLRTLESAPNISYFFEQQKDVFEAILSIVMAVNAIMYIFLSFHFHDRLTKPAFAIFATMRSFLKGNFSARIHIIGSRYVRFECLKINKYLEYVQENVNLMHDK